MDKISNLKFGYFILILLFLFSCKNEVSQLPSVRTLPITNITDISVAVNYITALSGGIITSDNGLPITERGICWSNNHNPTTIDNIIKNDSNLTKFSCDILYLQSNSTYYIRGFATNAAGTGYGNELELATTNLPILAKIVIRTKTSTNGSFSCLIVDSCGYPINSRGICWSKDINPTIDLTTKTIDGKGIGSFTSTIVNFDAATTYYVRAYASNVKGTTYSNEIIFNTIGANSGTPVTDIDGNIYQTINLGTQTWMVENLKTTRYRNGDLIGTTATDYLSIIAENSPKYQWSYGGVESNVNIFGRLYTWYAATDSRDIAPEGWHLPSDSDFYFLENYLYQNGYNYTYDFTNNELGKSVASSSLWVLDYIDDGIDFPHPDTRIDIIGCNSNNNFSFFNALPAGLRYSDGTYGYLQYGTDFWSSTEYSKVEAFGRELTNVNSNFHRCYISKNDGCSIRCIKDSPTKNNVKPVKGENKIDNYSKILPQSYRNRLH